ncbi:hypothetical protein FQZ97_591830 [compost metagenome]
MRVGQRDVYRLQAHRVAHLAPVGRDHVGRGGQAGGGTELGHHFAAGIAVLGAARVFCVGQHAAPVAAQAHGLGQRPGAVGVERDACPGEALGQCQDRLHFFLAAQHAALELEVVEAIAFVRGLGQADHRLGRHRHVIAQAEPGVVGIGFGAVVQRGALAVADIEQVAKHLDGVALLAFTQQCRHRHLQVLAEQVEQCRFQRGDGVDSDAQIEGLQAAAAGIAAGEGGAHAVQDGLVLADGLANQQRAGVFQRPADAFATRHFAHAGVAGAVAQDHDIAREVRAMGARQVHQHAVVPGHGHHREFGHHGGLAGTGVRGGGGGSGGMGHSGLVSGIAMLSVIV